MSHLSTYLCEGNRSGSSLLTETTFPCSSYTTSLLPGGRPAWSYYKKILKVKLYLIFKNQMYILQARICSLYMFRIYGILCCSSHIALITGK